MDEIIGQPRALDILRRALGRGRMHHAWIFSGPTGVGKFTTALAVARVLLDPDAAPGADGVPVSDSQGPIGRMVAAGTHPDLHVIRKELAVFSENRQLRTRKLSNIPLDVLRERMIGGKTSDDKVHDAPAYRTATLGHGKVFIIDEAELIDANGQNTLLKTLEEPPRDTYIFLVTSRPARLLPTIQSRCQHVRFGRLDDDDLQAWFERARLDLDPAARAWIESFCDGAPGIAVLAADYGLMQWHETLAPMIEDLDRGVFRPEMGDTMAGHVDTFANAWVSRNTNASKDAANKDGARAMIGLLARHVRERIATLAASGAHEAFDRQLALVDRLRDAERQLASNVNLKQVLENLVVQWARDAHVMQTA